MGGLAEQAGHSGKQIRPRMVKKGSLQHCVGPFEQQLHLLGPQASSFSPALPTWIPNGASCLLGSLAMHPGTPARSPPSGSS